MYKNFYEENYNAGKIKGTTSHVEDFTKISKKKMESHFIPNEKATLQQVYNLFNDTNVAEKKRRKDTIEKFKKYLSQEYPRN